MCNISEMYYEDGMKTGMKIGMEKQLRQIIKLMLSDNKSCEEIAKTLHMSTSEIERIAKTAENAAPAFAQT